MFLVQKFWLLFLTGCRKFAFYETTHDNGHLSSMAMYLNKDKPIRF